MKEISVHASKPYRVLVGYDILSELPREIARLGTTEKICIVSDDRVYALWGQSLADSLRSGGFSPIFYVFPAGEESKNSEVYLSLVSFLAQNQIARSDLILALGGGVVGDLAGFAAATYLRGIPYIQLPTSLLACVDSSVGGKTAIDLPAGKNLLGAFYQPSLVLCDTRLLETLPAQVFREGCSEIIKYAILYDPALFSHLEEKGLDFDRESVIARCISLKAQVVSQDECDTGLRQKLNLGHTIGHSVEKLSRYSLSHGSSVAIGLAVICRYAAKNGLCSQECCDRIIRLLQTFGLPASTEFSPSSLYEAALSDKKRTGSSLNLIVPREIGCCEITPIPVERLQSVIQEGL